MTSIGRRPHRKSRNGCLTCKRRRVKCDESGPPCTPCTVRGVECEYANGQRVQLPTPSRSPPVTAAVTSCEVVSSNKADCRRMLELELLHQWTTVTYQSYCVNVVSEYHNWQVVVPQLALKHECLLHGMLAMSALEIAAFAMDDDQRVDYYVNVALEYQNLSTSELRRQLCNVTSDNRRALFALSSILMVLGLAIPRFVLQRGERGNMLDYMMTYVALLKGLKTIADTTENFIEEEQLLTDWPQWDELPAPDLEPDVQCVFDTLAISIDDTSRHVDQGGLYRSVYKRPLGYLEENFSKCRGPVTRAYCLGWPLQAGEEYLAALTDRQPLALVLMMVWGVLLDEVCPDIWWAAGVGHQLVQDLSRLISTDDSNINASVVWARNRVAMPSELGLG